MSNQKAAQDALYAQIQALTEAVGKASTDPGTRASTLKNLAIAYRYVSGGEQPGAS